MLIDTSFIPCSFGSGARVPYPAGKRPQPGRYGTYCELLQERHVLEPHLEELTFLRTSKAKFALQPRSCLSFSCWQLNLDEGVAREKCNCNSKNCRGHFGSFRVAVAFLPGNAVVQICCFGLL